MRSINIFNSIKTGINFCESFLGKFFEDIFFPKKKKLLNSK